MGEGCWPRGWRCGCSPRGSGPSRPPPRWRAADDRQILPHALDVGRDDGGVAGAILAFPPNRRHGAFPDQFAGLLIEGDHDGIGSARRADQARSVDDRRFAELPDGHHLAAKIISEVLLPPQCTGGGVEADQIAIGAQGVDQPIGDGRRAAGAVGVRRADLGCPDFLARVGVERDHKLGFVSAIRPVSHGVDAPAGDRDRRVALADPLDLPEELRALGGPVPIQAGLGADPVAAWTAELGPIGGLAGRCD